MGQFNLNSNLGGVHSIRMGGVLEMDVDIAEKLMVIYSALGGALLVVSLTFAYAMIETNVQDINAWVFLIISLIIGIYLIYYLSYRKYGKLLEGETNPQ